MSTAPGVRGQPAVTSADEIDFTRLIRPGDLVTWTPNAAEPVTLIERLLAQRHAIGRFRVFLGGSYSGLVKPEHADVIEFFGVGAVGLNRVLCRAGVMQVVPGHLSDVPDLLAHGPLKVDVALMQLSTPDADGRYSVGAACGYYEKALAGARQVIAELNDQAPHTRSRHQASLEPVDLVVPVSRELVQSPAPPLDESDRVIARRVAAFIEDGAIVQTGVGALPTAVLGELADRRNLGIHSGVVGDAVVDLIQSGAVTNATKDELRGLSVTGGLIGTRRLYDFADGRRDLLLEPVSYTHAARTLLGLKKLVAVNSAVEVDLTGQVAAEVAGGRYIGAVGGQGDFVRGALHSEGGRSIIALPARTSQGTPRIVARIESGVVTTARADADVVVTEHGAAELRGQPIAERVRRMIAIAHPDDRDQLDRAARDLVVGG